jgi:hypothetical protein
MGKALEPHLIYLVESKHLTEMFRMVGGVGWTSDWFRCAQHFQSHHDAKRVVTALNTGPGYEHARVRKVRVSAAFEAIKGPSQETER